MRRSRPAAARTVCSCGSTCPQHLKMTPPAYQDLRAEDNAVEQRHGRDGASDRRRAVRLDGPRPNADADLVRARHGRRTARRCRPRCPSDHAVLAYALTGAFRIGDTDVDEGVLAIIDGDELTITGAAAPVRGHRADWPTDRRTGRSLRSIRDEHRHGDPPGVRRLRPRSVRYSPASRATPLPD